MEKSIMQTKIKILLNKKEEINNNYTSSDAETKKHYDELLNLIELELKLIEELNPNAKINRRNKNGKRSYTRRYSKK